MIKYLPEKDRELSVKFLNNREFDKLLDIVKSDIYKEKKKAKEDYEYESDIITNMSLLKAEIVYYLDKLGLNEPEDFLDYEEY